MIRALVFSCREKFGDSFYFFFLGKFDSELYELLFDIEV